MKKKLSNTFDDIISAENLLRFWAEFTKGKRNRKDIQEFSLSLMDNILSLHADLANKVYKHGSYEAFKINDPKPRDIHKATVRDRLLHRALYIILYPFFDRIFIADLYSCRMDKGAHGAIKRFRGFARKVSKNNTKTCWVLKCDIRKFFANIDHEILLGILEQHIPDKNIIRLLNEVIDSFHTSGKTGVGLPLGNLTSQLFVNIYMNKFDQFIKHNLKIKYYIRYCDDFVIFSENPEQLENLILIIKNFLQKELKLELHPNKVFIKTIASGVDFLGWTHFPNHRVLRTTTKKRIFRNIKIKKAKIETIQSYFGLISHGNGWKLRQKIQDFAPRGLLTNLFTLI